MNDQGLFSDILLTETLEIKSSKEKPIFKGDIFDICNYERKHGFDHGKVKIGYEGSGAVAKGSFMQKVELL